jgi:hypothetical protein
MYDVVEIQCADHSSYHDGGIVHDISRGAIRQTVSG